MSSGDVCAEKPRSLAANGVNGQCCSPAGNEQSQLAVVQAQTAQSVGGQQDAIQSETDGSEASADQDEVNCIVYGPSSSANSPNKQGAGHLDGFGALASEWNDLLCRSRFNTLFLTYEWQTTWWENLGEGELWILAFRRRIDDRLVGIAPLYLTRAETGQWAGQRRFSLVGCVEVSDYLDLIVAKGWEAQVCAGLRVWLYSDAAPDWDVLDLCNLPQDSLTYRVLPNLLADDRVQVQVSQEDVAPQFRLPTYYETYLAEQVDKKQRHEIRRKQRRAEREADVYFYVVGADHDLTAEMDDFALLQRASREDKAEFLTPEMRKFFDAVARRMLDAGWLRLMFLRLDNHKAASLLAFEYDRRFLLYNSGYDPEAYAQLSPGWVLLAYSIQYAIATGCQVFDFMQGDEEYKYRFGSQDYSVMRVVVTRM